NVPDAAVSEFDFLVADSGSADVLFDPPLESFDLIDFREAQILAIYEGLDGVQELFSQFQVSSHWPDLDKRLPLPSAPERVVIGERAGQRPGQGAAMSFRPKPQVHSVSLSAIRVRGEEADHFARDTIEESGVVDVGNALAARETFFVV